MREYVYVVRTSELTIVFRKLESAQKSYRLAISDAKHDGYRIVCEYDGEPDFKTCGMINGAGTKKSFILNRQQIIED